MRKLAPWLLKGDQQAFPRSSKEMSKISGRYCAGEDDTLQQWRKGYTSAYLNSGDSIESHLLQKKRGPGGNVGADIESNIYIYICVRVSHRGWHIILLQDYQSIRVEYPNERMVGLCKAFGNA